MCISSIKRYIKHTRSPASWSSDYQKSLCTAEISLTTANVGTGTSSSMLLAYFDRNGHRTHPLGHSEGDLRSLRYIVTRNEFWTQVSCKQWTAVHWALGTQACYNLAQPHLQAHAEPRSQAKSCLLALWGHRRVLSPGCLFAPWVGSHASPTCDSDGSVLALNAVHWREIHHCSTSSSVYYSVLEKRPRTSGAKVELNNQAERRQFCMVRTPD